MEIKDIIITENDIQDIIKEATPVFQAEKTYDTCSIFNKTRPLILLGVAILNFSYPPAAGAISALVAIMDKACEGEDPKND